MNNRFQTIKDIISSNKEALQSETKSSAGDKHETGRAMLQLEIEKSSTQLINIEQMRVILSKIDSSKTSQVIHLGSIVETNIANYFISISAGELTVENTTYFGISVSSPIGKILLGKCTNDIFLFNGKEIIIKSIY